MALFAPIIAPIITFVFREIVIKFVVFAAVFGLVAVLIPVVIGYIGPFIGGEYMDTAFSFITPGMWFWLDFFRIDFGLPLIITAYITRFMIRRLPVVG